MASYYYIKLYQEILTDPKMGKLSDSAFRRCIELFLLAGEQPSRDGQLPPICDIAWILRVPQGQLESDLRELTAAGITAVNDTEVWVVNFEKRQAALLPAEKQKRYRDRERGKALSTDNHTVTDGVTKSNADIDIDKEEDKEEDKNKNSAATTSIFRIYENEIGGLSRMVQQTLEDAVTEFGPQWVEDAIAESVSNNVRKWAYIKAILNNWKINGRHSANGKNGKANGMTTEQLIDAAFADIAANGLEGF